MRTRPTGVIAALIAVAALVVLAGPAVTREPGAGASPGPAAFAPLVIDRTALGAATNRSVAAGSPAPAPAALLELGNVPVPTRPAVAPQPAPRAGVVVKSTPTPRPGPRARSQARPASAGGGSWNRAEYSWYGPGFYGSGTACGQTYSRTILGVAHRTLPCGTRVTLRNPRNGRTITVRVIDRGPYTAGRTFDLSRGTCVALDNCYTGTIGWRLP